jgi:hypothetical protein
MVYIVPLVLSTVGIIPNNVVMQKAVTRRITTRYGLDGLGIESRWGFDPHVLAANTFVLGASQYGCTINAIYCMYSKLPAEDEQFIYSKRVEGSIRINLKRKCIWLVLITQRNTVILTFLKAPVKAKGSLLDFGYRTRHLSSPKFPNQLWGGAQLASFSK